MEERSTTTDKWTDSSHRFATSAYDQEDPSRVDSPRYALPAILLLHIHLQNVVLEFSIGIMANVYTCE